MNTKEGDKLITAANDCTLRIWDLSLGTCLSVFKFADPISCAQISEEHDMIFTGSWDKMVRAMDLKTNAIVKSFIASKESIKCINVDQ